MKKCILISMFMLLWAAYMQAQTDMSSASQKTPNPRLVVFVVGMEKNDVGDFLAILIGNELGGGEKYEVITRTDAVQKKLKELREYEKSGNVSDGELIEWGRQNNVSMLCLVTSIRLDEHMFAAQLTDVKSNKLVGSGDYSCAKLNGDDLKKVASALAGQLQGNKSATGMQGRSHTPSTGHPAEPEMVLVQGGTFWMGCSSEQQGSCENDESPLHSVTVSSFYIGKYEVTQAQWKLIMGNNPSNFKGDNLPVENVSWTDVQEFISRLNAATSKQYRLPTEAEWEYAARGGDKSRNYKYSGSHNLNNVGWFTDNSSSQTHPVGTKLPNELSIYDMSGNVWEWCSDWFGTYSASSQTDPMGASGGSDRVLRGGSWFSDAQGCRVSFRSNDTPGNRYGNFGFRLLLPQ